VADRAYFKLIALINLSEKTLVLVFCESTRKATKVLKMESTNVKKAKRLGIALRDERTHHY
jgi:hypothetical protein